ncbi:MAG: hypothetical protein Q4C47_06635 [Planctomycetia bacterium]|nr:hypothetical protein [Planctomycetia bacterium]
MYSQHEADGLYPSERLETVLSAILWYVRILASANGADVPELKKLENESGITKPRRYVPPTPEECRRQQEAEQRREWKNLIAMIQPKRV